jgi:Protein of unknown function (DUF3563)
MIFFSLCKLASRPLPESLWRRLGRLRREFLPTDGERDAAYLGAAGDRHDLEFRMKELDQSGRRARGPFRRF